MDDKVNPLDGWSFGDVIKTPSRATHDLYGKLFAYLHAEFSKFLGRLTTVKIDFELYSLDVFELPPHLQQNTYNRIEVRPVIKALTTSTRLPSLTC
jgi:hypothetical protein